MTFPFVLFLVSTNRQHPKKKLNVLTLTRRPRSFSSSSASSSSIPQRTSVAGQPRPPSYPRRNGPTLRLKTSRRRPCRQAPICRRPRRISGLACRRWAGVECRHRPLTLIARSFDQSIGTPLNLFYSYSTYHSTGTTKITRFATQTGVPRICVSDVFCIPL